MRGSGYQLIACNTWIWSVTPLETGRPGAHVEAFLSPQGPVWGPVLPEGLPGGRTNVDLGPRPWTRLVAGSTCLLGREPGAQVPGDDGQRVLLALAWPLIIWACWISQVAFLAAGHLAFHTS